MKLTGGENPPVFVQRIKKMGKHITEKERYQIEILLKEGYKPDAIAIAIGKSRRTIYYEIARGKTEQLNTHLEKKVVYLADAAQRVYREHKQNNGRSLKIGNDHQFVKFVEYWIGEQKYSPYAVLQRIKNDELKFKTKICEKTLYNYIDSGLFLHIGNANLPAKKERKKQTYKRTVSLNNLKGPSIEQRPPEIKDRDTYGHWEMDTVVSGQGKSTACLLVFSERQTREEIIFKIPDKKSASVVKKLNQMERDMGCKAFRERFKTITCDNGVEFLDFIGIMKSCKNKKIPRTQVYFCHPYSSWERGTNENTNKLIRRWIPKGTDISQISDEKIKYIEEWINTYPRRILEGKNSLIYKKEKAA